MAGIECNPGTVGMALLNHATLLLCDAVCIHVGLGVDQEVESFSPLELHTRASVTPPDCTTKCAAHVGLAIRIPPFHGSCLAAVLLEFLERWSYQTIFQTALAQARPSVHVFFQGPLGE